MRMIERPITLWDIISDSEREYMERQPFNGTGKGQCSGCGIEHKTEADFARHYWIPELRYRNLGLCPEKNAPQPPKV